MKNKNLTIAIVALFFLIIITFPSCKKQSDVNTSNKSDLFINLKPVSLPTYTTMDEFNDHLRWLAYSLASITDNTYMANDNPTEFKELIEGFIDENDDEVTFGKLENNINMSSVGIFTYQNGTTPSSFKSLVDVSILFQNPYYISTSPRSWGANSFNLDAFEGFNFNNTQFNTLIRIPQFFEEKQNANRFNKPFLVIPNEQDINGNTILPILGYQFNQGQDKVDVVLFNTEEDLDDQSDSYYIWVVDAKPIPVQTNNPSVNCLGDYFPRQNDGHCDYECGENSNNSFNDCNPAFLKDVWISEIEISEDFKNKCGVNFQWNESFLQGKYELGYSSFIAYGSGKFMPFGGIFNKTWHISQVNKTKKKFSSCNFSSNGNATMKEVKNKEWWNRDINFRSISNDENTQPKSYLARNCHPNIDTIYFFIFEDDVAPNNLRTQKVFYRPGLSCDMQYFSRNNEGPWGDKKMLSSTLFFGSISPLGPLNPTPASHVIMITPDSWAGKGNNPSDEIFIDAVLSSNGTNTNSRSIKLRVKYDQ